MGLCKCPKRRVTNQFCFEHRVNVCEHCMVTSHPKCIVQSYLLWLHDNDYNPICTLCSGQLSDGDCVRLTCYHMYHWACLDQYARNLPATTAPAGYTCPVCRLCIFPQPKLVSPVADVLREKLAAVNWARAGLGLPLLSDDREQKPEKECPSVENFLYQNHVATTSSSSPPQMVSRGTSSNSNVSNVHIANNQKTPYSVVNIDSSSLGPLSTQASRKVCEAYDDPKDVSFDHDENKYQRKSAIEWILRWWKLISTKAPVRRRIASSLYKRYTLMAVVVVLFLVGLILLCSWLGRMTTDGDPSFDVLANPNLKFGEKSVV
ncbi:PREDICTED: zinc finger protein-like 1 [Dinoponera quadriceps]|uniref:Zinc finger protein-like 1 homolog n=1 Tax=Dinoponera quadriceps TaxID=609295 RepID=A0A6P3X884_DINQU|nr:PREDICTED: zinc finger protein-like 1 [Dinoponera quadriceps]